MSKPAAQTLTLIRLAAAVLTSNGVSVNTRLDKEPSVWVSPELMIALCEATNQTPTTSPVSPQGERLYLNLTVDDMEYSCSCDRGELHKFGAEPTTTETEEGAPIWGPFAKDQVLMWFPTEDSNRFEWVTLTEDFPGTRDEDTKVEALRDGDVYPTSVRASHLRTPEDHAKLTGEGAHLG